MSQRWEELVREDLEGRLAEYDGLFSEIIREVIESENDVPQIPEALLRYSRAITNEQIRLEASAVFLIWLGGRRRAMHGDRFASDGIASAVPCEEAAVIEAFLPDFPYAEDFVDGTRDLRYRKQHAVAEIEMALAKQVCSTKCPLRIQCLARSIKADGDYPQPMEIEPWSVSGGWGAVARESIARRFHELRRDYLLDRMPIEERADYEAEVKG